MELKIDLIGNFIKIQSCEATADDVALYHRVHRVTLSGECHIFI